MRFGTTIFTSGNAVSRNCMDELLTLILGLCQAKALLSPPDAGVKGWRSRCLAPPSLPPFTNRLPDTEDLGYGSGRCREVEIFFAHARQSEFCIVARVSRSEDEFGTTRNENEVNANIVPAQRVASTQTGCGANSDRLSIAIAAPLCRRGCLKIAALHE